MSEDILRIGDKVLWRGGHGRHVPLPAIVESIEVGIPEGQSDGGTPVEEIDWSRLRCTDVVIDVKTESGQTVWARGENISKPE